MKEGKSDILVNRLEDCRRAAVDSKQKEGDRMSLKAKRGLLIANARAGKQGAKTQLFPIISELSKEYTITVHLTEGPGDAAATGAEANDFDTVFVSGGDGTVNGVISGMIKAGVSVPVGYFPSGTANDLATTLKLSRDVVENAQNILAGTPKPHDVGLLAEEYPFLYTASFGAFTKVAYETPQDMKNMLGHVAYILNGAAELFNLEAERMSVQWDDGELSDADVFFFAVMNTHSLGGLVKIAADRTDLADGLLDMLVIKKPRTLAETNALLMDLLKNNLYDSKNENIIFAHSADFRIRTARPVAWTIDGERTQELTETTITTLPEAVKFIR